MVSKASLVYSAHETTSRRSVSLATVTLALVVTLGRPACLRKGGAPATVDAGPATPSVAAPATSAAPPPPVPDAGSGAAATSAAAIERSKRWLGDLRWMVDHKVTVNPDKAGEGDAASKCDAVEEASSGLGNDADAAYRKNLEDAAELCAFDVPLVTAREALDRLAFSPSQASRLLQCNVARREIGIARAKRPNDPRARQLEARRVNLCK
jgi:hypothetical protein